MLAALAALNPDEMSPREAMEALYRLKEQAARTACRRASMMNIAERTRAAAPAAAQAWLGRFADGAAGARRGRGRRAVPAGRAVARRARLHLDHPNHGRPRRHRPRCCARRSPAPSRATSTSRQSRTPPRWVTRAGTECIEAIFEFETAFGPCNGVLRLVPDGEGRLRAWTLNTNLHELRGHEEEFKRRAEPDSTRDFGAENWADRAGAGSAPSPTAIRPCWWSAAARPGFRSPRGLRQLGIDTLIVDRHARIGDNWRTRYHSLTLHNEVYVNHLPYLPFPPTFPVYIPKDKLANWFEAYVESLELNFWTGTELVAGRYDDARKRWSVTLRQSDGAERIMHPRHLIFATGVCSIPSTPDLPGLADFAGTRRAFRRLQARRGVEGPQGAGARQRHQRPRRRRRSLPRRAPKSPSSSAARRTSSA